MKDISHNPNQNGKKTAHLSLNLNTISLKIHIGSEGCLGPAEHAR